jgi:hypothetical protein
MQKKFFSGLVELEEWGIYVLIESYKEVEGEVKIRGETIPRDVATTHKSPWFDKPEYYKNVLECFKRNEDIGKKDLIILKFFSKVHPIHLLQDGSYSLSLLTVWLHERYGHLQLHRKLGMMKWYGLMEHMLWSLSERIFSVKISMEEYIERKRIIEKVIKKIEHFIIKSVILNMKGVM